MEELLWLKCIILYASPCSSLMHPCLHKPVSKDRIFPLWDVEDCVTVELAERDELHNCQHFNIVALSNNSTLI
jgi:hypothetical protein